MDLSKTSWCADWSAIDLKEVAQVFLARGYLEEALAIALDSVRLRGESRLIRLSLRELRGIFLEMLKIDKEEETASSMPREAHRYDARMQTRPAQKNLEGAEEERRHGFYCEVAVTMRGLELEHVKLNGQLGKNRGRQWPQTRDIGNRYSVLDGNDMPSFRRGNANLADVVVQLALEARTDGSLTEAGGSLQGDVCATFSLTGADIKAAAMRREVAEPMRQLNINKYDNGKMNHVVAGTVQHSKITLPGERHSSEICKKCGASPLDAAEKVRRCAECLKTFHYCSDDCARSDWESHRRACRRTAQKAAAQ